MDRLISYRNQACIVLFSVFIISTCTSRRSNGVVTERSIANATLSDGVEISLTYGTLRNLDRTPIIARAASPGVIFTIRSGPLPDPTHAFEIQNIAPNASIEVQEVVVLTSENEEGCPFGDPLFIACKVAEKNKGQSCQHTSDCEKGLFCKSSICTATEALTLCSAPIFSHSIDNPTSLFFDYNVNACRKVRFSILSNEKKETTKIGILGKIEELDGPSLKNTIESLEEVSNTENLDFFVFLGDHSSDYSSEALDELAEFLNALPVPVIMNAGDIEAVIEGGSPYLRRFGPHEHSFSTSNANFVSFYSATGSLGEVGLQRVDNLLAKLSRKNPDLPLIVFTHTPPIDIQSGRDQGFRNPLEGGRVQAILNRYHVDMLFTGNSTVGGSEKWGEMNVVVVGDTISEAQQNRKLTILTIFKDYSLEYHPMNF